MYRNVFDVEAARRMLMALTTYRRVFDIFVRSGMNTTTYDELAVCMEEIRLAKQEVFRLLAREVIDLVLIHSEVMTHLWQQQLSEIRGLPSDLARSEDRDTQRLRQTHEEAMTRLDTACRDIIAGVADGRTLPSNDSLVVQRPRYATGW
jgi:hypothetical protein